MVDLRDSTTYQIIVEEGKVAGLQDAILRFGGKLLGVPTDAEKTTLRAVSDLDRLLRITDQVADVSTWQELLATP